MRSSLNSKEENKQKSNGADPTVDIYIYLDTSTTRTGNFYEQWRYTSKCPFYSVYSLRRCFLDTRRRWKGNTRNHLSKLAGGKSNLLFGHQQQQSERHLWLHDWWGDGEIERVCLLRRRRQASQKKTKFVGQDCGGRTEMMEHQSLANSIWATS